MKKLSPFWQSIAKDIETAYDQGHPSNWKQQTIKAFLADLEDKLLAKSGADHTIAEQIGVPFIKGRYAHEQWATIVPSSFRKIFVYGDSQGKVKTRQQFAIYLGYRSTEHYLNERNITIHEVVSKNQDENDLLEILKRSLKNTYRTKRLFAKIDVVGNQFKFLESLPMDKYFVELSSLSRNKIDNNNSLFIIEKEGTLTKRKKKSRNEIFTNYLSTHIASESILSNYEQNVIVGNPGVGKSTYARWLCYQWANETIKVDSALIYINLRELNFSSKNPVLEYVKEEYLSESLLNKKKTKTKLRSFSQGLKYILDGLDEIEQTNKFRLEKALQQLGGDTEYPPYMLLTRPYGLRNTYFQSTRHVSEILGFNETQRVTYAKRFLSKYKNNYNNTVTTNHFLELVDESPVLKDISFNPLMLSYLVLMYITDRHKKDFIFQQIDSPFQLQNRILDILIEYHARDKKIPSLHYIEKLELSKAISGKLELNKEFVYKNNYSRDPHQTSALLLSELGLGRYEETGVAGKWQFYFNSITFQEFLAAEHFGHSMTIDAFIYLLGDTFYWNFGKMLLGYAALHENEKLLLGIIDRMESKFSETKLMYYARLKIVIISELSPAIIQKRIDKKEIAGIIEFAYWAKFDDLRGEPFFDAITPIFQKMSDEQQAYFIGFIPHYLSYFLDLNKTENQYIEFPDSILTIVERLSLYNDPTILDCFFDWLIKYHKKTDEVFEKSVQWDNPDYEFENSAEAELVNSYNLSMKSIYGLLEKTSNDQLKKYKKKIKYILQEHPESYKELTLMLLAKTLDHQSLLDITRQKYEESLNVFQSNLSKPNEEYWPDPEIEILVRLLVKLAANYRDKPQNAKRPVIVLIEKIRLLIEAYRDSMFFEEDKVTTIFSEYTDALVAIDIPDYYDEIFKIATEYELIITDNMRNPDLFIEYIEDQIKIVQSSENTIELFNKLLTIFYATDLGKVLTYKYKNELFEILAKIIKKNENHLSDFTEGADEYEEHLLNLVALFDKVDNTFQYPYDRKFLVKCLFDQNFETNEYVCSYFIPELMTFEFTISGEQWLWDFIHNKLLIEKKDISSVINILNNEHYYKVYLNATYILNIWKTIFNHQRFFYFYGQILFSKCSVYK
ncbi:MAG: NACHT domain-containing protein, partial [Bacteroidota bacterium]